MGFADRVLNMNVTSQRHWVPRGVPILGSTDRHLAAVLAFARLVKAMPRSDRCRPAVDFAADHHRPQRAGHLVGERHGGEFFGLARHEGEKPRRGEARFGGADRRGGTEHQEPAQGPVALPADPAGTLAAGGGVLLWRDAEPGGEVARRAEPLRLAYFEREAHRAD